MLLGASALFRQRPIPAPHVTVEPALILANGYDTAQVSIDGHGSAAPTVRVVGNPRGVVVEGLTGGHGHWVAHLRAGVVPGLVRLEVALPGSAPAGAELNAAFDPRDSLEDGTPDFLRLDDEHDRRAFRRWFTFLAEAQYFSPSAAAEIEDCAALIRYAYREALHAHDGPWAAGAGLPVIPAIDSVAKFQYPYTPLGASLFRVRPGPFRPADLGDGAFAQFADAQSLWRYNCHLVSRDVSAALPGDLLFFRPDAGTARFHSMIYLGESQIRSDGQRYFVYHTGPRDSGPGEIRRLTSGELLRFPQPEWRPVAANPGFLGVYRWNILCSAGTN